MIQSLDLRSVRPNIWLAHAKRELRWYQDKKQEIRIARYQQGRERCPLSLHRYALAQGTINSVHTSVHLTPYLLVSRFCFQSHFHMGIAEEGLIFVIFVTSSCLTSSRYLAACYDALRCHP